MPVMPGDSQVLLNYVNDLDSVMKELDGDDGQDALSEATITQWAVNGNSYYAVGKTVNELPSGLYEIHSTPSGPVFEKLALKTDNLISFPETNSEKVIEEIQKFWGREEIYKQYRISYRRGLLLYGPPGNGKTSAISLIIQDVIKRGGIAVKFTSPDGYQAGIRQFRSIQPNTPIVVLMEDIDGILESYNESTVLNILDGVDGIKKIVYLATTNYPDRLGERIVNRPSRFDKRFQMNHLGRDSRRIFFNHFLTEELIKKYDIDIEKWLDDTEDMSIAHLNELFSAVCVLGNTYEETIELLTEMNEIQPSASKDPDSKFGFNKYIKSGSLKKIYKSKRPD